MCKICENTQNRREITFSNNSLGLTTKFCVGCIAEYELIGELDCCKGCDNFININCMTYDEEEGEYYCEDCYHEYQDAPDEQEEARVNYFTHSKRGIK